MSRALAFCESEWYDKALTLERYALLPSYSDNSTLTNLFDILNFKFESTGRLTKKKVWLSILVCYEAPEHSQKVLFQFRLSNDELQIDKKHGFMAFKQWQNCPDSPKTNENTWRTFLVEIIHRQLLIC